MRAAIFHQGGFSTATIPDPVPAEGQVLVRTRACGICGSDLHAAAFPTIFADLARRTGGRFQMVADRPVVFGHEFVGEVVANGPGTEGRFKPGDLVTSMPLTIAGRQVQGIGYNPDLAGGFAEYLPLAERMLLPIPPGMDPDHAALVEPMAVGVHAVAFARTTPEDVALVIGCGPIGLATIAALKLQGISPVIAADFSPARRALARRMGADLVLDPATDSPYAALEQAVTPEGFDAGRYAQLLGLSPRRRPAVVFECVGVPGVVQQIMEGAPAGARIVVVGVCMEPDRIEPLFGIVKQLSLQFVLAYTAEEFAATLGHIAAGRIDVAPLITGRTGLDGVGQAFRDLASPEVHAKVLVEPWR
ncbi:zinc-binding dehydrogenase [Paracraurococcus ruber]|uniref:Alcohol dehydrogenase n=1 Tax=Paracraurococcus ruber TaxID=77675 RepID=A0ABS1D228_9PROT|nr:zinc-binding dehydrogenase [Paracraurococcus ruber]MBK1660546.1 alcohol dehydrogenase [Paracraurococcus ruber]TDG27376.1 alcohol dehydrogenase [Paracraurococcus ruber]